eukprot:3936401-Rhodomonas_salina.1
MPQRAAAGGRGGGKASAHVPLSAPPRPTAPLPPPTPQECPPPHRSPLPLSHTHTDHVTHTHTTSREPATWAEAQAAARYTSREAAGAERQKGRGRKG